MFALLIEFSAWLSLDPVSDWLFLESRRGAGLSCERKKSCSVSGFGIVSVEGSRPSDRVDVVMVEKESIHGCWWLSRLQSRMDVLFAGSLTELMPKAETRMQIRRGHRSCPKAMDPSPCQSRERATSHHHAMRKEISAKASPSQGPILNFRSFYLMRLLCLMGKIPMQDAMPMPLVNKGNRKILQNQNKCRCEDKQHQRRKHHIMAWPNTVVVALPWAQRRKKTPCPVLGKNQKLELPLHHFGT